MMRDDFAVILFVIIVLGFVAYAEIMRRAAIRAEYGGMCHIEHGAVRGLIDR